MADRICDNCMSRVPAGSPRCPKCGIRFENANPGGALPNGWVLAGRYTVGRYIDIDGEGVTYSAIDGNTLQRVTVKEFMPVTLCAARDETGAIKPKPGCEVLFKTTRMDFSDLFATLLRMGLVEGLVQVLDVVEENNTAYAVMEKIEGPTLAEYLTKREGPVEAARALALMRPVMAGVDMMHASGLVHRGISPENITLESGGTAKLGGFATLALRQQGSELKPKLYPGYSAPEQYAASEFEGRYTDIYALGAVLYRLVTGIGPVPADERKLQDSLRPARALNREVPAFLSTGIARSMRIVPAERIQNIPDLRLSLAGEGSRDARGPLGLTKQQLMVGAAALGAVVLLVIIILVIVLLTGNRQKPASSSSLAPDSSVSTAATILPDFVDKRYEDIALNPYYQNLYLFAEPEYQYSDDVAEGRIISQDPLGNTLWDGVTPIKFVVSKGRESFEMPNLVTTPAITQEDALKALAELGITEDQIKIETVLNDGRYEPGIVIETIPVAGTMINPSTSTSDGNLVTLKIAADVTTEPMPDILNLNRNDVESTLNAIGVKYQFEIVPNNEGVHKNGLVASTSPAAGQAIAVGSTVVKVQLYDNYVMPAIDSNLYLNKKPGDGLTAWLDARGIPYRIEEVTTSDASLDGTIQKLEYTVGVQVNSGTPVIIYVYRHSGGPPTP